MNYLVRSVPKRTQFNSKVGRVKPFFHFVQDKQDRKIVSGPLILID
jgi:hypothetical protein